MGGESGKIWKRVERAAKWLEAVVAAALLIGVAFASVTGWAVDLVRTPERVREMSERQERIVTWVKLRYCEIEDIPPTQCNPDRLPDPRALQ